MTITTDRMTIAAFEAMAEPLDGRHELINGEVVETTGSGPRHNLLAKQLMLLLDDHVRNHALGIVFTDGASFILNQDPPLVRVPDIAFVSRDRIPSTGIPIGFWPGAPDLAVEVVSPDDRAANVRAKVGCYLSAGTRLVWVLWPEDRAVTVYRAGKAAVELGVNDSLDGGDVLPGFAVRVADLFEIGV